MSSKTIYLRVWRTAFERGKLELKYATHAECVKTRLNLYRAVKDFRDAKTSADPGFTRLIDQMEIVIEPYNDEFLVVVRNKELNPLVKEAARALDEFKRDPTGPDMEGLGG